MAPRVRARCAPTRRSRRIANAVFDAVGVRIDTMPITPERILRALKEQRAAGAH